MDEMTVLIVGGYVQARILEVFAKVVEYAACLSSFMLSQQREISHKAMMLAWKLLVRRQKRLKITIHSCVSRLIRLTGLSKRFYINKNRYLEPIKVVVLIIG